MEIHEVYYFQIRYLRLVFTLCVQNCDVLQPKNTKATKAVYKIWHNREKEFLGELFEGKKPEEACSITIPSSANPSFTIQ